MFEGDNLVSDKVFEKSYDCLCQWMTDFRLVISFCSMFTLMYLI